MSLLGDFIRALVAGTRAPSISISRRFAWTGYTKEVSVPLRDVFALLDAINLPISRPEYQPKDGVTHCNQYVSEVCENYGFRGLDGLLANAIIDVLVASQNWTEVSMEKCQELANSGTLILAGLKDDPHGHVNVICPGRPKTSGRWGSVPSCANVGKEIFIGKGINWAFSDMPKFWAWRPSLP